MAADKKTRVLEINVDDQGNGGVFSLIKNVIEEKPDDLIIDIACLEPFENKKNIAHFRKLGTRVFFAGYKGNKLIKQAKINKHIFDLVRRERYDCVHIHSDVSNKLLVSGLAARLCNVKKIILHAHATGVDGDRRELKQKVHNVCRYPIMHLGAVYAACSFDAARWMYPGIKRSEVTIIQNGIDLEKFKFSPDIRNAIRDELGFDKDDFVIGHVGRFMYQKNHSFIINVFDKLKQMRERTDRRGRARLLLIGDGELMPEIKRKAENLGLSDDIIFYGISDRVNDFMQGMDAFILPSNFEGFGMSALEAQACGLPVLCSEKTPSMVNISDTVEFLPIYNNDDELWAEHLLRLEGIDRNIKNIDLLEQKGYSIDNTVKSLLDLYKAV